MIIENFKSTVFNILNMLKGPVDKDKGSRGQRQRDPWTKAKANKRNVHEQ